MTRIFIKSHPHINQVRIKGLSMNGGMIRGCGMGSVLLGQQSGSASATTRGATPAGMLGEGFGALSSINLRSEGSQVKKKLNNIKF
jgi:hypothetical protein